MMYGKGIELCNTYFECIMYAVYRESRIIDRPVTKTTLLFVCICLFKRAQAGEYVDHDVLEVLMWAWSTTWHGEGFGFCVDSGTVGLF